MDQSQFSERREPIRGSEVVYLDREFSLFDPRRTKKRGKVFKGRKIPEYSSEVRLHTDYAPPIPFHVWTHVSRLHRVETFTPFNPGDGAVITPEYLDLQRRLSLEEQGDVNFERNPLYVEVASTAEDLVRAGIIKVSNQLGFPKVKFKPGSLEFLNRLRLCLLFPNGQEYASATTRSVNFGYLRFHNFYPVDLGPLASGARLEGYIREGVPPTEVPHLDLLAAFNALREGLTIALPSSESELNGIKGKFFLSPIPGEVPPAFSKAFQ